MHGIYYTHERVLTKSAVGDLKPANIMLDLKKFDPRLSMEQQDFSVENVRTYITDLDTFASLKTAWWTDGYISPELAFTLINSSMLSAYLYPKMIEIAQTHDLWCLGLCLAKLMQPVPAQPLYDSRLPNLKFILNRMDKDPAVRKERFASLPQAEIDSELNSIKANISSNTKEGQQLLVMWNIVHKLLQVDPSVRPSASKAANMARVELARIEAPLEDYGFKLVRTSRRAQETSLDRRFQRLKLRR